jgi:hypothetical protein
MRVCVCVCVCVCDGLDMKCLPKGSCVEGLANSITERQLNHEDSDFINGLIHDGFLFLFVVLDIKFRALHMLGKYSAVELHTQPLGF